MRTFPLSFLIILSLTANAAPSNSFDSALDVVDIAQTILPQNPFNVELRSVTLQRLDEAKQVILRGKKNLERWVYKGRHYIKQNNLLCSINSLSLCTFVDQHSCLDEFISHPDFTGYDLRVTEPELCDPSVKQHSGYLDIANDKHLFFW